MYQIGSRLFGLHTDESDYDYVEVDLESGEMTNDHFDVGKHCFHYNREYLDRAARFEIDNKEDFQFVYNAIDYVIGIININPFDYRDKWIEKLKGIDFRHLYWWSNIRQSYRKVFYNVVYNLEVLKSGSFDVTDEMKAKLQRFHDLEATQEEYEEILSEIREL